MTTARLALLTLRCRDLAAAERFYSTLGLDFVRHRHGSGPEHLSSESRGFVFELYPLGEQPHSSLGTRVGFAVDDLRETFEQLVAEGAEVVRKPRSSEWGLRAVVKDLDGHAVELLERERTSA